MFRAAMHAPALLTPGQALARGVCRLLLRLGFAPVTEFVPTPGLRADACALGPRGEIWIVECKSGPADFRSDAKWPGYLDWCDGFLWAVGPDFPLALLPPEHGIILGDAYDAELLRPPPALPLAPARRRALALRFARTAAERLRLVLDPEAPARPG